MLPRILAGLVGLLMFVTALGWLTDPASAAASLGMPWLVSACTALGRKALIGHELPPLSFYLQRYSAQRLGCCTALLLLRRKLLPRWF
jgi:hypothetical protein